MEQWALWSGSNTCSAHHACAFYRRKNLHDLLTVNSRGLTKLILLSSFHDFFQRNNSPCQSTTLLKATLLLNENQLLLFSFKRKVKELPLLIWLSSPRLTRVDTFCNVTLLLKIEIRMATVFLSLLDYLDG